MKAYKVFNENWTCRNYDYKTNNGLAIGSIHEINENLIICKTGFHCCLMLVDCFNYYDFNLNNKVAEVEILGETDSNTDKISTNKIKIVKELNWIEVLTLVNTGKNNTGNSNSGNRNSGYSNSGNSNSGNWNSSDNNNGSYNSITQTNILIFNKECDIEVWNNSIKPNFTYFNLTEWVYFENMTDKEKKQNPNAKNINGYLRKYEYKEAFINSYNKANKEDKSLIFDLPNFDTDIFYEISGIDLRNKTKENILNE